MAVNAKKPQRSYRLQLVSEREGRTVFSITIPLWLMAVIGFLSTVATALLVVVVMTQTPLRGYLPGYLDRQKRAQVVESAMKVDSLEHESLLRSLYLDNMLRVLRGEQTNTSLKSYDSTIVRIKDTLLAASERERNFVVRYEANEIFGLRSVERKTVHAPILVPVRGRILPPLPGEDSLANEKVTGQGPSLRIGLDRETTVIAPFEGTVVSVRYVMSEGWEVMLLGRNDYLMQASRLTRAVVWQGREIKAGTALGQSGAQKGSYDRWMRIRLWRHGYAIEPQSVITF